MLLLSVLAELSLAAFAANYGNIPLHFEPNLGQASPGVRYVGRARGYTFELDGTQATVRSEGGLFRMRLAGARAPLAIEPVEKLPGITNYLNKPKESDWVRNVPQYRRLKLAAVYPGIDLIYYGAEKQIEYDFVVAPHADPGKIRFRLDGARLEKSGELLLPGGFRQLAPVAYQEDSGRRVPVKCRYEVRDGEIRFAVGRYDRGRKLVIDPTIAYATFAGTEFGWFYGVAVDRFGAAYATGRFANHANIGTFVAKLNPAGNAYVYLTFLGDATPSSIAVNSAGAAFVTGQVSNPSFPVKNAYQSTLRSVDMFLTKVNPTGNDLEFSTFFGGSRDDFGRQVRLDPATGAIYLVGDTNSTDVPLTSAVRGAGSSALVKFNENASALIFSTYLPNGAVRGMALEPSGNVVVSSREGSGDLVNPIFTVASGAFLTRVSPLGVLLQVTYLQAGGGPVAVDGNSNIFVGGTVTQFAVGVTQGAAAISKIPAGTTNFNIITGLGTGTTIYDLACDPEGNVYATGTAGGELPEVRAIQSRAGSTDAFLTKTNGNGTIVYSTYYGGSGDDEAYGLAVDAAGAAYLAGSSGSSNLPLVNAASPKVAAIRDGYLAKITDTSDSRIVEITVGASPTGYGLTVIVDGFTYPTPARFNWVAGSTHTISTQATQVSGQIRAAFTNWTTGNAITQQVTTPATPTTYVASFALQVRVEAAVFPVGRGTVTFSPSSVDGYYNIGSQVTVTATPSAGYQFLGWTGALSGANAVQTLTVNGAATVVANFTPSGDVSGLGFVPVTPCRVIDTRPGFLAGGGTREVNIPSSPCGIPGTARAYSIIVTVVPRRALSYLTVYPTGQPRPLVSTLNAFQGQIIANSAIVPAGTNGAISVFVTDDTDFIIDIYGYFSASSGAESLMFYPVTPCRLADTRVGNPAQGSAGPPPISETARSFPVVGNFCGIPATARAYSLNITVVPTPGFQYITAWPTGQTQPFVSVQNSPQGHVIATTAIIPGGTNGMINLAASGTTDAVVDITGYFAPAGPGGLRFFTVNPCRVADTRPGEGFTGSNGPPLIEERGTRDFVIGGRCGVPVNAQAFSLNATVVPPAYLGFVTLFPGNTLRPLASTLNAWEGQVAANAAIVPGNGGAVSAYVSNTTHLILDVNGYFAGTSP